MKSIKSPKKKLSIKMYSQGLLNIWQ